MVYTDGSREGHGCPSCPKGHPTYAIRSTVPRPDHEVSGGRRRRVLTTITGFRMCWDCDRIYPKADLVAAPFLYKKRRIAGVYRMPHAAGGNP